MNQPSLSVRVAGTPRVAVVLFAGYAFIVYGWYQGLAPWYEGHFPWWLALAAVMAAGRTLRAVRELRYYKAWLADWQAMGRSDSEQPVKKRSKWKGAVRTIGLVLVAVIVPVGVQQTQYDEATAMTLKCVWGLACIILAWKLCGVMRRSFSRVAARSAARREAKAAAAPVAWLLPPPSFSPSRASARRNLPDYARRLIKAA